MELTSTMFGIWRCKMTFALAVGIASCCVLWVILLAFVIGGMIIDD